MQLSVSIQRCSTTLWLCVFITLLLAARAVAGEGSQNASLQAAAWEDAQDATVQVAALQTTRVRPTVIGADGPELTQVDQAQRLGLTGKDITICVIDTGVDIRHPTFGKDCPDGPACRLAFGYDVESQGTDPTPSDWANAGGHGTHVSGIALGGFPHKLKDADGNVLPYQRGVAFGAKLGAIRASTEASEFPYDYTRQALEKTVAKKCDIDNMSLGGYYVTPSKQLTPTVAKITAADIIITAAQGNDDQALQTGARVFNVASPGAFDEVFSIGHVNNTANPGSILELDKPVATAAGKRTRIVANQRADTHSSLCNPDCSSLNLPRDIVLIKMVPREPEEGEDPKDAACDMETVTKTKHAHSKGHVILLQIPAPCKAYQNAQEIWDLLQTLKPVLVLITLPTEEDSNVGPLYYRNQQTPVLWLRQGDGQGLAAALTAAPEKAIRLLGIPGAELVPVKEEFAGQPATTSALGPGYDLSMKPDISAPGSLYSSLPNSTYQTWPGTSMAAPYMAGVIALWKESVKNQGIKKPKEGWIRAAHIALKNTARPLPWKGSDKLMWSPVKVGSGVVQAYNAVINRVKITPTQLLVRTDVTSQKFTLTVMNTGDTDVTYKLSHKPAVTLHLPRTWYGDGFDASLPVAQVAVMKKVVTVPAKETVKIDVKITVPQALKEVDGIYGGYIMFTPSTVAASALHTASHSKTGRIFSAATALPSGPVPLSVPYQGSSKDYSTLEEEDSLVLFVPPMHDVDKTSAEALESKPPLFLCNVDGAGKCGYAEKTLKAPMSAYRTFRFASTLVRPVADVKVQVWSEDGKKLLGTSASQGPGGTAPPLRRTYLAASSWDGRYFPKGSDESDNTELKQLQPGHKYKLKLLLYPVLAAADRLAGREATSKPFVYELDTKLHLTDDSVQDWEDTNPVPENKATTKSRKASVKSDSTSGSGSDDSDGSGSDKSSSSSRASSRSGSNGQSRSGSGSSSNGSGSSSSSHSRSGSGSTGSGSGNGSRRSSQSGRSNSNSSGGGGSSQNGASSRSSSTRSGRSSSTTRSGSSSSTRSKGSSSSSNGSSVRSSRRSNSHYDHVASAAAEVATAQVSRADLFLEGRTPSPASLEL